MLAAPQILNPSGKIIEIKNDSNVEGISPNSLCKNQDKAINYFISNGSFMQKLKTVNNK